MTTRDYEPWINIFYVDGELVRQEEHSHTPLTVGDGFLDPLQGYRRFRVVDVWLSNDSHGHFAVGRHVFLKDVTGTDDDLLGKLAPAGYFTA